MVDRLREHGELVHDFINGAGRRRQLRADIDDTGRCYLQLYSADEHNELIQDYHVTDQSVEGLAKQFSETKHRIDGAGRRQQLRRR